MVFASETSEDLSYASEVHWGSFFVAMTSIESGTTAIGSCQPKTYISSQTQSFHPVSTTSLVLFPTVYSYTILAAVLPSIFFVNPSSTSCAVDFATIPYSLRILILYPNIYSDMYTISFLTCASLLSLVLAGPLPREVVTKLADQQGAPTHFPFPLHPGGLSPSPSGILPPPQSGTGSAPASTGTSSSIGGGATTSVNVRGTVTGPLAVSTINDNDGKGSGNDVYKMYSGDGSTNAGWPALSDWVSFDAMFTANQALMKSSCSQFSVPADTDEEISDIRSAIESVALATKVDHRFILAIIMQESKGCVRVHTTNYGVRNPGLMQDHDGQSTCNDDKTNQIQTPCPKSEITGMIAEGTGGTAAGPGLAQLMGTVGGSDVSSFYKAARAYNSGSVDTSGDLGKGVATHCYASDVANRLMGWVQAPTGCTLDGGPSG